MPLAPGTRIGPYQIVSFIGAGGMGAVYRARDTRLGRDVAIKIMTGTFGGDSERIHRFQLEAQSAGALNDPNILAVYDIGLYDEAPYLVSELLEGETLRARLRNGALPVSKVVEYGRQIAFGLAAAHGRGITHRDIKPENLFVTRDGRVKILDFGLAKIAPSQAGATDTTVTFISTPGIILGTAAYMSPEQVRGEPVDHRSDLFSLGCVIFEMATGSRAFPGRTDADRMSAVLKDDPHFDEKLPLALQRTIRHCLDKDPDQRFQSARDLAFDLESMAQAGSAASRAIPRRKVYRWIPWLAAGALAITCAGLIFDRFRPAPMPVFRRLTFSRGVIHAARFTPDGSGVIYGARWDGGPADIYTARVDVPGSRSLGLRDFELRGISPKGDLALLRNTLVGNYYAPTGTLSLAPFSGGSPRDLDDKVAFADWSPFNELAVVRVTDQGFQLEYPVGSVLYRTAGFISHPRVSPSGELVAFIDHSVDNNSGLIAVVDRKGSKRNLSSRYSAAEGLAWRPDGREVWFTAAAQGVRLELRAVNLKGRERVVYSQAKPLVLLDVSRDGRVLVANEDRRMKLLTHFGDRAASGPDTDKDMSWLDWSLIESLSPDAKWITFSESGEGAGPSALIYVRETSGAPPALLGEGHYPALSPDGASVVSSIQNAIEIYPVRAGAPRIVRLAGFTVFRAGLMPDAKTVWFRGSEPGKSQRYYLTGLNSEAPRPITPDGFRAMGSGPILDGAYVTAVSGNKILLYPTAGGEPREALGLTPGMGVAGWSADGAKLYVFNGSQIPFTVERLDWKTGAHEPMLRIDPADRAGLRGVNTLRITPDGKSYAYSVPQQIEELHSIEGLK